jgi:hypothetical protein
VTRRRYESRHFDAKHDRNSGRLIEDVELHHCTFTFCSLSITRDVRKRTIVRRVDAKDCFATACHVWGAIVEDVTVDGLLTTDTLRVNAAAFRHVTLKGRIGRLLVSPALWPGTATLKEEQSFACANAEYYQGVDWALDIRDAEFEEAEIQGVPCNLIRRDPTSQVVVRREKVAEGTWRTLDLAATHWAQSLQFLLDDGFPEKLLIAPRRSPNYPKLVDGLAQLRDAGIADPD